jgi:hypothetical protein
MNKNALLHKIKSTYNAIGTLIFSNIILNLTESHFISDINI